MCVLLILTLQISAEPLGKKMTLVSFRGDCCQGDKQMLWLILLLVIESANLVYANREIGFPVNA